MLKMIFKTNPDFWAALPLRISLGFVFIGHGSQKLFGWFGGKGIDSAAVFFSEKLGLTPGIFWAVLAGSGEFFGGLLVLLGFLTRFGALNIAVVMIVAILKVHWGAFFLPAGIEFALALLCSAAALIITGGGKFSVDSLLLKKL